VLPSLAIMEAAGYPATPYAYPFGAHGEVLDTAVLEHVVRVRTTPGECPDLDMPYPPVSPPGG
jgi:hypothetical protein